MSALYEDDAVMAEAIRSSSLGTCEIVDAILAAGYSKPRTITLWGVAFVHNGAFYKEYPTKEDAQKFADEMTEVGAHMRVVTREHTPAVYGEWVTA